MKILVRSEKEPIVIRFGDEKKYKTQVLKFLEIIKGDEAFTLDDILDKFLEVLKAKVKTDEDRKKLLEKLKEILKDFEEKK